MGKKQSKAELIHEAADALFCERGFHGVSVNDVAKRAQVNKALVFYYYKSKEELFERVLSHYYEAHMTALTEAYEKTKEVGVRLHKLIDAYLDFMVKNSRYARLIQLEVASGDTRALIQKNLEPLIEWFIQALSDFAPEEGPLAAKHFFVTFSGIVINYFTYAPVFTLMWEDDPLSDKALQERREHVHWMLDMVLQGLKKNQSG